MYRFKPGTKARETWAALFVEDVSDPDPLLDPRGANDDEADVALGIGLPPGDDPNTITLTAGLGSAAAMQPIVGRLF